MAEVPVYCFCGQSHEPERFMIQCDYCNNWFHGCCVGVKEYQSADIDKFFCTQCEPNAGPTIYKTRTNWHRHDQCDPTAEGKPVQAGTPAFIEKLKSKPFTNGEEIIVRLRGHQATLPYLHANGFTRPILVEGKDGLGLHVPQENFTVQDVENYVGSERMLDVIDVVRQTDIRMSLHDFVEYYTEPVRTRTFNVISLEFSDSHLSALVEAPYIARKLCWVNNYWPRDSPIPRPEVQKYCLMGVKDSYTDFHVDFGGSSVWYHVFKGEKVFYFIKPTPANLEAYKNWMLSSSNHEVFLGDIVDDDCYKVTIQQGQTMLLPTGWIHAVWTSQDSLVFGGNFLHGLNIPLQLGCYEIEKAIKTPERFCFPCFETLNWLAAERIVEDLHDLNSKSARCPEHLVVGAKAMQVALKSWWMDKENGKRRQAVLETIPEHIAAPKLLRDLNREIRNAERHNAPSISPAIGGAPNPSASATSAVLATKTSAAVKKERGTSQRVRHKPKARADYVDITEALSNFAAEEERQMKSLKVKTEDGKPSSGPVPLKILLPKKIAAARGRAGGSVEDLDDDDEDERPLMIDERKTAQAANDRKQQKAAAIPPRGSLKIRLSVSGRSDFQLAETTEVAANMDVESGDQEAKDSKNGIDSLLRASSLSTPSGAPEDLDKNTGRASPSTREAIAGMLSMSRGFAQSSASDTSSVAAILASSLYDDSAPPPLPSVAQRQRKGRRRLHASLGLTDDAGDVISKVHQDDEYIYPSLDASDDEMYQDIREAHRKKSSKSKRSGGGGADSGDESWNPRARFTPVVPKTDRPVREGVKRPAVERVLEAAAQKRALEPVPKRPYHKKKKIKSEGSAPPTTAAHSLPPTASTASPAAPASHPLGKVENKTPLVKKPKKGMATPKQRLSKILKLHKF